MWLFEDYAASSDKELDKEPRICNTVGASLWWKTTR